MPYVFATLTVNTDSSSKRLRLNEKYSTLWHKRLGHISRQIMERLIKDEILPNLDFSDFDTCVDYIKGKLTAKVRNAKIDRCTFRNLALMLGIQCLVVLKKMGLRRGEIARFLIWCDVAC